MISWLLLLGSLAVAQSEVCNGFSHLQFVRINSGNIQNADYPPYQCADIDRFDRQFAKIAAIAPVRLDRGVIIADRTMRLIDQYFNGDYSQLVLGFNRNDPASIQGAETVFVHEVGHQIFQRLLETKIELLRASYSHLARVREFSHAITTALDAIGDQCPIRDGWSIEMLSNDCQVRVQTALQPLSQKYPNNPSEEMKQFLAGHRDELNRIYAIAAPYHELYADVVMAVFYGSPNVARRIELLSGHAIDSCRTFNERLPIDFVPPAGPHCLFSSIRFDLWQSVIGPGLSHPRDLLSRIGHIFGEQVSRQIVTMSADQQINHLRMALGLNRP